MIKIEDLKDRTIRVSNSTYSCRMTGTYFYSMHSFMENLVRSGIFTREESKYAALCNMSGLYPEMHINLALEIVEYCYTKCFFN